MKRYFLLVEVLIALAVAGAVLLPFSSATLNTSRALLEKTKQIEQ